MIIGVGGASCSGKSTLCSWLHYLLDDSQILRQDAFYKSDSLIPIVGGVTNWDSPEALEMSRFKSKLQEYKADPSSFGSTSREVPEIDQNMLQLKDKLNLKETLIVDGFLIYSDPEVYSNFDITIFLKASKEELKRRRDDRQGYVTTEGFWADPKGYFEEFVWPQYIQYNQDVFQEKIPGMIVLSSDSGIEKMVQDAVEEIVKLTSKIQ